MMDMSKMRVGIVVFDDVEVLDYCGPFEVLSVTRLRDESRHGTQSPFDVLLVGKSLEPIRTTGGMRVLPDTTFQACPGLDIVMVPGGWGARAQMKDPEVLNWLKVQASQAQIVASVCTGALVLGQAGLLDGHDVTTHWLSLDVLRDSFPDARVAYDRHFVRDGPLFTSAGISAGIDMTLKLVEHLFGEEVARSAAKYMEYPYPGNDRRRIEVPDQSNPQRI